jgi:hypothetical protein
MREVKFRAMRRQVLYSLASLADSEYQWRVWVHREYPPSVQFEDLNLHISILYDDMGVLPDPT